MPPLVPSIKNCGRPSSRGSQPIPAFCVRPKMSPLGRSSSISAVRGRLPDGPAAAVWTSSSERADSTMVSKPVDFMSGGYHRTGPAGSVVGVEERPGRPRAPRTCGGGGGARPPRGRRAWPVAGRRGARVAGGSRRPGRGGSRGGGGARRGSPGAPGRFGGVGGPRASRGATASPGGPEPWGVWGAPRVEGRHGFAGATRAFGGFGGPFAAPHVLSLRAAAGNAAGRGLGDRPCELFHHHRLAGG